MDSLVQALGLSGITGDPSTDAGVVVALLVIIVSTLAFVLMKLGGSTAASGDTVLLLGDVGAGKTVLFYHLAHGELRDTHTSTAVNEARFVPKAAQGDAKAKELRFVDFPGHGSLQAPLSAFFSSTRAVVFMVDATAEAARTQVVAQRLFALLVDRSFRRRKIPILLVLNKTELPTARTNAQIKAEVEDWMEKTRHLQISISDIGSSEMDSAQLSLGVAGKPFGFEDSPCAISLCRAVAAQGEIGEIMSFIQKHS